MRAAISNAGRAMPPAYIWDGEDGTETPAQATAFRDAQLNMLPGQVYAHSGRDKKGRLLKGTMTRELWKRYFVEVFLPNLAPTEKPALLIIDGHAFSL